MKKKMSLVHHYLIEDHNQTKAKISMHSKDLHKNSTQLLCKASCTEKIYAYGTSKYVILKYLTIIDI